MQLIPDIESDIPVPLRSSKDMPEMAPMAELRARTETIKLLSDLKGEPILPTEDDQNAAENLARQMMADPQVRPDFAKYPNSTTAFLAGMVAQMNVQIVDELSELKMYVVNKLVFEVENAPDSRTRIAALAKLGEVDGVDAFKKRSEMTVQVKPIAEVEQELLQVLDNIEYRVLPNAHVKIDASEEESVEEEDVEDDSNEEESDGE
jgi:hypothetical protein